MRPQDASLELLGDLLRLLKKYGPDTFEKLASTLANGKLEKDLGNLISPLAKIAKENGMPSLNKKKREKGTREELSELRKVDPIKADLLLRFRDGLLAKAFLPTSLDLRNFALECGLPKFIPSPRLKAVSELIRAISSWPTSELERRIEAIPVTRAAENGLDGWSRVILNQRQT